MKKTKKALASLAIAGMSLSMIPFNVFAASTVPTRIAGVTAEQTAVQIAEQTGYTGAAILASSTSYGMVDALTAGPLAASLKAPILLTGAGTTLDAATKAELTKLEVKTVYVTSGTAVIKQGVIDELKAMGIEVVNLGGYDRAETSVNIAKKMTGVTKVAVANTVVDALSIAAVASAANQPILLTDRDALPASVATYLASAGVAASDVIGGTGVISDAVKAGLPSATRHAGMTAYDTNNQVIQDFAAALAFDNVYVANGVTGIDALAGAPLAAQTKSPIVLTDGKTVPAVAAFTFSKASANTVVTALGGEFVVPEAVRDGVAKGQVTPDSNVLQIVSVSALDASNKYLEIVFSKPVSGLRTSDITVKNADTLARFGVKSVQMSSNNLTATVELYAADDADIVLEYLQDYVVTVNANGTILTATFNRPYSLKVRVQDINVGDKEIVVKADTKKGEEVTLEVPESLKFDYQGALGELVQVWYNGDNELVSYKILSTTAKYDAIEVTDEDEIKLLGEDKKYDISDAEHTETNKAKFTFYVDGEEVDIDDMDDYVDKKYNFAKVGFDTSGDIEFVSAYALKDFLIVESVDDDEVIGVDGASSGSFDAEDATIVKDGKVIDLADLEEGDLLFFSEDADDEDGYAEVLNNKMASGEIEEVYSDSIEVDGEIYAFDYGDDAEEFDYSYQAIYIDEDGDVADVDDDAAEELQAAGDVTLYGDYAGNLIYIAGDTGFVESNNKIAVLTEDIVGYHTSKDKIEIEVLTQDEEELSFDINLDSLDTITLDGEEKDIDNDSPSKWSADLVLVGEDDYDGEEGIILTNNADTDDTLFISFEDHADAGSLVKLHLDDNGNIEELEFFSNTEVAGDSDAAGLEDGDKYLDGHKMTSSTLMFDATDGGVNADADDIEVVTFGDFETAEIEEGYFVLNEDNEVEAVWYSKTDNSAVTYDEAVVTKILRNTDKEVRSITVYAGGEEKTYAVDDVDGFENSSDLDKGDTVMLVFDEDNDDLVVGFVTATKTTEEPDDDFTQFTARVTSGLTVSSVDVGNKSVKFQGKSETFKLADNGLVLDVTDTSDISKETLSDLRGENNVTIVRDTKNANYVKFFLIGDPVDAEAVALEAAIESAEDAQVAYIAAGGAVGDIVYTDVTAAITGEVTATILSKTALLNAATAALTDASDALADAIEAAGDAQAAYIAAGGSVGDAVYTDVTDAITAEITADIEDATEVLEAATADLEEAAAVIVVNASTNKFDMKTAVNNNRNALGISTAITLEAADYLYTMIGGGYADAEAIRDALADYAAL
ncbi:cell wall-binding repeat-containing protein [Desulfosporosinus shakirovi]|uniref:cell wall-binding repeat-containing protein n=1 Tax=Desulfosporosinus shakirovi TaxID=2885154 RepID=UPI001E2ED4AD|nr:cell wall-binding repeat-containing protein [Desulfosporosinus sp. SRJS8]MCB8817246.1 cell wall-binding repeat-containing protein [Desulfosporosinus sp. SRJS8]